MDGLKVFLIVSITLTIVIIINLFIFYRFSKPRNHGGTINMIRKAAQRGRRPWEDEDKKLQELSSLIDQLSEHKSTDE